MNKNIFYIYPEMEGKQNFVCWGFSKETTNKNDNKVIKEKALEALKMIASHKNSWISKRSFNLSLGEDHKNFWVAIPRELSAKAMKIFAEKLAELKLSSKVVVTSHQNPFGEKLPFSPVVSYDRGFIFDSSKIEEKLSAQKTVNF